MYLFYRPEEVRASAEMTAALASRSEEYLPNRILKLFYPASGWDLGAVFVALELIEKGKIDSAELYFCDLNPPDEIFFSRLEELKKYVEELKVEKSNGLPHISFKYKGKPISITYYKGIDWEVIKNLPKDLNLLYFHAHGMGGILSPYIFPPTWKAFIQHCEGKVTIFSHAFPRPLIDIIADWCLYTPHQFDRWQTVLPAYTGGAALGLDLPVDVELIEKVWEEFKDPNFFDVYEELPSEDMDKLAVSRTLKRLRELEPKLSIIAKSAIERFLQSQEFSAQEAFEASILMDSDRGFVNARTEKLGFASDMALHGWAGVYRKDFGIDLTRSLKERLEQCKERLKGEALDYRKRIFLLQLLLKAACKVEPVLLLDIYEQILPGDNIIDKLDTVIAVSASPLYQFLEAGEILREAAKRIEGTDDKNKLMLYWRLCQLFPEIINGMFSEHPLAKDKVFKFLVQTLYDAATQARFSEKALTLCSEAARLLAMLDLDRALNYMKSPESEPDLVKGVDSRCADAVFFPIIRAVTDLPKYGIELTGEQKAILDEIYRKYQWPMKMQEDELKRHLSEEDNMFLCADLKRKFEHDIASLKIIEAMSEVPRHLFLPTYAKRWAYVDRPLPTYNEQTISQPWMVVEMTKELNLKPGDRVLEIGAGVGWHAAIMSELVGENGHIYTIEYDKELAERAKDNIERLGIRNITVYAGRDGGLGLEEETPFDAIIFTCGIPQNLKKRNAMFQILLPQLKKGGRMVFPETEEGTGHGRLVAAEKTERGILISRELGAVLFAPLRGRFGHGPTEVLDEEYIQSLILESA